MLYKKNVTGKCKLTWFEVDDIIWTYYLPKKYTIYCTVVNVWGGQSWKKIL